MSTKTADDYKVLKIVCVIAAFILTWLVNEEWIFEKFFAKKLLITFSGINSILDEKKLGREESGFNEVLYILEPKTDTGTVMYIQWGGSAAWIRGRENQSSNTYWFMGTNEFDDTDKKLGEITYNDAEIENKIYAKYKLPIVIPIRNMKTILLFLIGFYGVYTEVKIFSRNRKTIPKKFKKRQS